VSAHTRLVFEINIGAAVFDRRSDFIGDFLALYAITPATSTREFLQFKSFNNIKELMKICRKDSIIFNNSMQ
jgi:hypothetical protein